MEQAVKVQSVTVLQSVAVPKYHWVIRINYLVRAISFAALFVAIGMHMASRGYGAVAWGLLALQFLAYPHLLYWRASSAREPLQAERTNLLLDCLLVGIWAAALEFPVLIAFTLFIGTSLNSAIYRGWRGALGALIAFSCGALGWVSIAGFSFSPYTDLPVSAFTLAGLSAYVIGIGNIVFTQNRKLHDTREELRKSEEFFRLITENAGDLIALLDAEGHWVYAGPSYRHLLSDADLEAGSSALAHVHREDRDLVRAQLKKTFETGDAQEFSYRLIATDGNVHEFKATVNSFSHAGIPRAVVISIDISELRRTEKILDIYSHAFENMAEGMILTSADGTILSVNKAFAAVTGFSKEDAVGRPETEFHTALQPPKFYADMHDAVAQDGYWVGTTWSRRKDNSIY
ncbi:MAG: PAS domain S-box protein, partial [Pseudomonadota bacterium]